MGWFERWHWGGLVFQAACVACERQLWRNHPDRLDAPLPAAAGGDPAERSAIARDDGRAPPPPASPISSFGELADHWCRHCLAMVRGAPAPSCRRCGAYRDTPNPFGDRCRLCRQLALHFDTATAIGNYGGLLQQLVLRIKREPADVLAFQLGRLLGWCLAEQGGLPECDAILPMPTHWTRRLKRGFHPAAAIAEGLHRQTGLPLRTRTLILTRPTRKQGLLSTHQRFANVRSAFRVRQPASVAGRHWLLVDDVMTTGATCSEAARALRDAGAASVRLAIVARGARVS